MAKNGLITYLGVVALILIVGLIFAWDALTNNVYDLFIGALGLLTFVAVFYSFALPGNMKNIELAKKQITVTYNQTATELLKKMIGKKDKTEIDEEIKLLQNEKDETIQTLDYLNLNKWLFISVLLYLLSITAYLLKGPTWTVVMQILSFWGALMITFELVVVLYSANILAQKNKDV